MPHQLTCQEDSRTLLERLRRFELEKVLSAEGIQYPPDIPAFSARYLLMTNGVNVEKYVRNGELVVPQVARATIDVDNMKMAELRQYCAKAGIHWSVSDRKSDLQRKIRESLG